MNPNMQLRRTCAILAGSAALALAAAGAPLGAAPAKNAATGQAEQGVVLMSAGTSRVVNLPGNMSDVIIADPNVVDVHVRSQRQLYLIAKGTGQTDVTVTTEGGRTLYHAVVRVGTNLTSVDQMIKMAMPDADVKISSLNGLTLLTGTVASPEDAAEAESLVATFLGDKDNAKGTVRIAEVNKQIGRQIGANFMTYDGTGGFKFGMGQGRTQVTDKWLIGGTLMTGPGATSVTNSLTGAVIGSGVSSLTSGGTFAGQGKLFGLDILASLDAAENQGLAATLANPNLTALSGETASFLAGGEIPIPMSSSLGNVSVDYKQYGVSLAFTPTVLADGRISMRVRPEVSQIDDSAGVKLNGFSIPGISTRRAETTVELGSGQSFIIGGLLSASTSNSISKTPFLGSLPILGNLFRSQGWNRRETELIIVVTPYLVKPVNAADVHLPTDGLRSATDAQRYLGAQLHDGKTNGERPKPKMAPPQTVTPDAIPNPSTKAAKGAAPGFSF